MGHFSFWKEPSIATFSLIRQWLTCQVQEDVGNEFILQLVGALPHFNNVVRTYLDENLPNRCIGRSSADDLHLHYWTPWSPDLIPLDFFPWGFVKDKVLYRPCLKT